MSFLKKFRTKLFEGILFMSSTVTSLTVLLIILFLFKEGISIYGEKPVEHNSVVAINAENKLKNISAAEIKLIFDSEITNWKEVGGKDDSIIVFRIDNITEYYAEEELGENLEHIPEKINDLIAKTPGIIAYFPSKYLTQDFKGQLLPIDKITLSGLFGGKEWFPTAEPASQMGFLPLILGTLWVSLGAILLALPLGLAVAIYMAEVASHKVRNIYKPVIELLSGIPSVVYGFFGLVIIVPLVQQIFNIPVGETALSGSIVLAIMALPTIITISEDAIRSTPKSMKEASLALGASHLQTIFRVTIPYSISGITAAAILGIGRAIGETMAVLMVTGNAAVIPGSFLEPVRTIPATIAAELGEAPQDGLHYKALFALGCILFIITLAINLFVEYMSRKNKKANS